MKQELTLAGPITVASPEMRVKQELEDLKQLLKRAQKYDIDHNEPECEVDEKVEALKAVAKAFGVEIEIK